MRLVNTQTLQLEEFLGRVPEYAILSHTWGDEEVTLQEWQATRSQGNKLSDLYNVIQGGRPNDESVGSDEAFADLSPPETSRITHVRSNSGLPTTKWFEELSFGEFKFGYWKILKACAQARVDGYRFLWADTNCIDKTSSSELSEAINSMYAWYKNSAVCYAYLEDVHTLSAEQCWEPGSPFRTSRWFTRGWTLQELLAPKHVQFFCQNWTCIGPISQFHLWEAVGDITGIEREYLLHEIGIYGASIAKRMSWVANRTTTRPEDIAYCLLGIFDVNMPLIYGEGSKAFIRLQEEIIKVSDDHSIFAWTWLRALTEAPMRGNRKMQPILSADPSTEMTKLAPLGHNIQSKSQPPVPEYRLQALQQDHIWQVPKRPTLLAPDPACFYRCSHEFLSPSATVQPFSMTNAGLSISLPLLRHVRMDGDEDMVLAVLHRSDDTRLGRQTLIMIPLTLHHRQRARYTRTWFPLGPLELERDIADLPPPTTVQVCRDVQQVQFYYNAFGGTSYQYGFWLFFPRGVGQYRLAGGYLTDGLDGVFNNHGIFLNAPSEGWEEKQGTEPMTTFGGLLVLESAEKRHLREVLIYLAFKRQVVAGYAMITDPHCDVQIRWSGALLEPARLARAYEALSKKHLHTSPSRTSTKTKDCSVKLITSFGGAALSHHPDSRITVAEIIFPKVPS